MKYIKVFEDFKDGDVKIINWELADELIPVNSYFKVIDKQTNKSWMLKRSSGKYHADVEPVELKDAETMLSCFTPVDKFEDAEYRPVIVEIGLEKFGAALMGFSHCGSNKTKFKEKTKILSGGFRNMRNWDSIRDNGVVGHFCLHFQGSIKHTDKKPDYNAQQAIKSFIE